MAYGILVQALMYKLVLNIDPRTKAGVLITQATVGTVDGDQLPKQRQLDIYNDARMALFSYLKQRLDDTQMSKEVFGIMKKVYRQWTVTSNVATFPLEDDFMGFHSMFDLSGYPILLLEGDMRNIVMADSTAAAGDHWAQSKTLGRRYMYFVNGALEGDDIPSSTFANNEYAFLNYFGVPVYTLTDVTGGTTKEAFNYRWHPVILQLAEAINRGAGMAELNALAQALSDSMIQKRGA